AAIVIGVNSSCDATASVAAGADEEVAVKEGGASVRLCATKSARAAVKANRPKRITVNERLGAGDFNSLASREATEACAAFRFISSALTCPGETLPSLAGIGHS